MADVPELSREHFEILAVRELRKAGLEVAVLRTHRRAMLPDPERGYLVELVGVLRRGRWEERALIQCRCQERSIGAAAIEALSQHLLEAKLAAGILFGVPGFEPEALRSAEPGPIVLFRVVEGRTAFDTGGWGTPGHYPAWLPAYCAQLVARDALGQPQYALLDGAQGDRIVSQLIRKGADHGGGGGATAEERDGRAPGLGG
jgi:Restriction endonuclease